MRLLLIPDVTAPNGVDAFCTAIADRAPKRGHQASIQAVSASAAELQAQGFASDSDLVLVNSLQPAPLIAARAAGKKTALRLIDSFAGVDPGLLEQARKLASQADLIFVPSRYLSDIVRGWGVTAPIAQAPYAYEHIMAQQIALVTIRASRPSVFQMVAGGPVTSASQPGFETLLSALARLRLDWHLSIFGDGPALVALQARAQEMVAAGKVSFVGDLPQAKVLEFLRAAKVYIEPCGVDGFPVFALHSLSEGCPVVGARAGAIPELIVDNENGLLYPTNNPVALSEAIVTLASVKGLSLSLISGGIKTIESRSWDATCTEVFSALEASGVARSAA